MSRRRPIGAADHVGMVAIDGLDALCAVIIRPTPEGGATAEAYTNGIPKHVAGQLLLQIAQMWIREGDDA